MSVSADLCLRAFFFRTGLTSQTKNIAITGFAMLDVEKGFVYTLKEKFDILGQSAYFLSCTESDGISLSYELKYEATVSSWLTQS